LLAYHNWSEALSVDSLGLGQGHGSEGAPVVGALHDDHVLLLGRVTSELDGSLDSLGTTVPKEERIQRLVGHDGQELLDQVEVGLVEADVDLAMDESADLLLRGSGNLGVAVAQVGNCSMLRMISAGGQVGRRRAQC
jgi:hypothetical protein